MQFDLPTPLKPQILWWCHLAENSERTDSINTVRGYMVSGGGMSRSSVWYKQRGFALSERGLGTHLVFLLFLDLSVLALHSRSCEPRRTAAKLSTEIRMSWAANESSVWKLQKQAGLKEGVHCRSAVRMSPHLGFSLTSVLCSSMFIHSCVSSSLLISKRPSPFCCQVRS